MCRDEEFSASEDVIEPIQFSNDLADARRTAVEARIATLNHGVPVNCKSPKQVSAAIFGSGSERSTSKTVLRQVAAGDFPELDDRKRQLAALIIEHRSLMNQRATCTTGLGIDKLPTTANKIPINVNGASHAIGKSNTDDVSKRVPLTEELASSSSDSTRFGRDVSSFDRQIDQLFARSNNQIDSYWKDALLQLSRPSARALVSQLDPEQCPMGYDPLATPMDPLRRGTTVDSNDGSTATTTAGKKGSFLAFCREQKEKYPDCVLLTRCGDFYETFGIDAILLVEHCGLNAMAGKAKAGCPIRNVQATLDCLTAAGFRVAVFEEGADTDASRGSGAVAGSKSRIKSRFLAQIVSEASPTYLYDLVLLGNSADTLVTGPSSRPYVGVISALAGYTLTEVWIEERIVRVSERLTVEAVACRLAAYPPADPLFYVPPFSAYESGSASPASLPFLPSRLETSTAGPGVRLRTRILPPTLVQREGDKVSDVERAKRIVVSALLQLTECQEDDESSYGRRASVDDFTLVATEVALGGTQTQPLHLETATQLGLMNDKAIPSLVSYLVPDFAPAATRRFLRRLLLTPPPPNVGEAVSTLLQFLIEDGAPCLPPLSIPPVGKVMSMVRAGQASAQVYSELLRALDSTIQVLDVLSQSHSNDVVRSLMVLLEYESGMAADPSSLRQRCLDAIQVMEDVLCPIHHVGDKGGSDGNEQLTDFGGLIPLAYFERNEATWRGRVRYRAAPEAYQRVQQASERLAKTVACDFWGFELKDGAERFSAVTSTTDNIKNLIVQDIFNNLFALKEIPKAASTAAKFIHPIDRNGKILRNRYTTEAVQSALSDYVAACDYACAEVSAALVKLSDKLHDAGHLPAIVQASHTNLIMSAAFYHTVKANSLGWNLAMAVESDSEVDCAGHFNALWPYWMDQSEAVDNTFDLSGMWVLTAPNMSGKSTIMRSTAAAALLTVCGLFAPLKSGSSIRRFDHLFVRGASSDIPSEQKSAFGAEMGDIASLLRCCGERSLVFVDELGRGTSPHDGTRLAGAVLEAMAGAGMSGVFSTHLHDILKLPLLASNRIATMRMAIQDLHGAARYKWTYRLESGICTDSMALETAERFGLPSHVIARAEELAKFLVPSTHCDDTALATVSKPRRAGFSDEITGYVEEATGQRVVHVASNWNIPATFDGKSAVYILKLRSTPPRYYVGESDNLRIRLEQHRAKGGAWHNCEVYAVPSPSGKSVARMWESLLIRKLASEGFALESISDGRTLRSVNSQ
jgi:MutS domain V/MutS domain I